MALLYLLDSRAWNSAQALHDRDLHTNFTNAGRLLSTAMYDMWNKRNISQKAHNEIMGIDILTSKASKPWVEWTEASKEHYDWLRLFVTACATEYAIRFSKSPPHPFASSTWLYTKQPPLFIMNGFTPPPQDLPDEYKLPAHDWVMAYRNYYKDYRQTKYSTSAGDSTGKPCMKEIPNYWTNRGKPAWLV